MRSGCSDISELIPRQRYTSGAVEKRQVRAQKIREDVMQTFVKMVCRHSCPANPPILENAKIIAGVWCGCNHPSGAEYYVASRVVSPGRFHFFTPDKLFQSIYQIQYSGEVFSILARWALATGLLHAGVPGSDSASSNNDADNNFLNCLLSENNNSG